MELDEATTSTAASRVSKASVSQATDIRAPGTRKCAPASVATEAAAGAALEPTERVATASPTARDRVAGASVPQARVRGASVAASWSCVSGRGGGGSGRASDAALAVGGFADAAASRNARDAGASVPASAEATAVPEAASATAGAAVVPADLFSRGSPASTPVDRVAGAAADAASALVGAGAASPPLSRVSGAWVIEAAVTGASVSQAMDA